MPAIPKRKPKMPGFPTKVTFHENTSRKESQSWPVGIGPRKASILGVILHLQNHLMTRCPPPVHQETECTTALKTQLRKCHSIFTMILNPIEVVARAKESWVRFMYPRFA